MPAQSSPVMSSGTHCSGCNLKSSFQNASLERGYKKKNAKGSFLLAMRRLMVMLSVELVRFIS